MPAMRPNAELDGSRHQVSSGLLLLMLSADCEQQCAFCALKTYNPPRDDGDRELAELLRRAREARQTGTQRVQLEGIDPVRFSRILELTEALRALGFTELIVMGTARRFADAAFRRAFLDRAPASTTIVVPLYGVTPEVHDAVTGRPGSLREALAALDALIAVPIRAQVKLTTVPTRGNAKELAGIIALGARLGVEVLGRLPYPLRPEGTAIYGNVALEESRLVDIFRRSLSEVPREHRDWVADRFVQMLAHPCVAERAGDRRLRVQGRRDRWRLDGADTPGGEGGTRPIVTVPCPRRATCELADRCPGEHYAAYESLFGLAEFYPPGLGARIASAYRWLRRSASRPGSSSTDGG